MCEDGIEILRECFFIFFSSRRHAVAKVHFLINVCLWTGVRVGGPQWPSAAEGGCSLLGAGGKSSASTQLLACGRQVTMK